MGITLRRLTLSYGSRILLDRVSADLPDSALTALLGRNGTGKSTLLRAIAGLGPSASPPSPARRASHWAGRPTPTGSAA